MMISIRLVVLLALMLCSKSAISQQPETPSKRPALIQVPEGYTLTPTNERGKKTVFRPSVEYQIFNELDWKLAGHALEDYVWLWHYSGELELKIALLEKGIDNLEDQKTELKSQAATLRDGLTSMSDLLDTSQKRTADKERRARVELWLWRSATIVCLVGVAFLGGAYAIERGR